MTMKRSLILLLIATLLLAGSSRLAAASAEQDQQALYTLHFWTVDGGGGAVSGENGYTLKGTVGQPDTGWSEQDDYQLVTGFWAWILAHTSVFLPLIFR
jgi:hypothetical protein